MNRKAHLQTRFPRALSLLGSFGSDHPALEYTDNEEFLEELEAFLSLDRVPGFNEKLQQFRSLTVRKNVNQPRVGWLSLCAELGALQVIKKLGLPIIGFEQKSPRALRGTCDMVADCADRQLFLEVKRNSAEEKQGPPEALRMGLRNLEGRYYGIARLIDRNYDSSTVTEDLRLVQEHIRLNLASGKRPSVCTVDRKFEVLFLPRRDATGGGVAAAHFEPVSTEDLRSYLLGTDKTADKVPMVQEALKKGADYLMCQVPAWDWSDERIIMGCFEACSRVAPATFESTDQRLGRLSGVILFREDRDFRIVNNAKLRSLLKA